MLLLDVNGQGIQQGDANIINILHILISAHFLIFLPTLNKPLLPIPINFDPDGTS